MKQSKCLQSFLLMFFLFFANILSAQDWHEKNDYKLSYNLTGKNILIIGDDETSWEELVELADVWKSYGAVVKIAAPAKQFNSTKMTYSGNSASGIDHGGKYTLEADLLITEVNIDDYNGVYLPGGDSYESLTTKHKELIADILNKAYKQGKVIGAICHGPGILSITNFIKGKKVTVEGGTCFKLLSDAGALIQDKPVVMDKNILTTRFPYIESTIYSFAEMLQYPNGGGPLEKINNAQNLFLKKLENLTAGANYQTTPVNRDKIKLIIKSGLKSITSEKYFYNPHIRFICVDDKNKIDQIKALALEKNKVIRSDISEGRLNYLLGRTLNAPVLLFVYNDLGSINTLSSDLDKKYEEAKLISYNGASCQNIILAANELGLGVNLVGTSYFRNMDQELRRILNLPENYSLVNVLNVGYPELKLPPVTTRPVDEFLYFNNY